MKSIQPNFEAVKTAFYQTFADSIETDMHILMEMVAQKTFLPSYHKRLGEFKKDLNHWLDTIDIRMVGVLIDIVSEKGKTSIPGWMKRKQFVIDYNNNEALDLIRTDNL